MPNKVEILVEVDPNGKGAAGIKNIQVNLDNLKSTGSGGGKGALGNVLGDVEGAVGIPVTIAAITAGVIALGKASLEAANAQETATRLLKTDAQGAGIEFSAAQAEARKFAAALGLSTKEGEVSFARLLRVIKSAGEVNDLQKITKNFENVAAAYGLTAEEVETLTNQLLSGQDEALNKLGISDPSVLYKKFADSVGKTVEQLSDQEKVQIRLNAVSEKGEGLQGVAEERLASESGKWQVLKSSITDAEASLGKYIQSFKLYQILVESTPRVFQAYQQNTQGFGFLGTGILNPLIGAGLNRLDIEEDEAQQAKNREAKALAEKSEADFQANLKKQQASLGVAGALANPYGSFTARTLLIGTDAAKKEQDDFVKQYEALFKDKRLSASTAEFAQAQFEKIRGILDPKKATEIAAGLDKLFEPYAKVALGALKKARDAADKNFGDLAEKYAGGENPYVKVLVGAETTAKEIEKTFSILGEAQVNQLKAMEEGFNAQRIAALQLDDKLKSNALRRQANALENPVGLSGGEERALNELSKRIAGAVATPGLLATANALLSGSIGARSVDPEELLQRRYANRTGQRFEDLTAEDKFLATNGKKGELDALGKRAFFRGSGLSINKDDINDEVFSNLQNLQGLANGKGLFGAKAKEALSDAFINLFGQLDEDAKAEIATLPGNSSIRQTFADAFKDKAASYQDALKEELLKAAAVDKTIAAAREDLVDINAAKASGLTDDKANARFLATLGTIQDKDLPADLRGIKVDVLRNEADRVAKQYQAGLDATNAARVATENLTKSIDSLAKQSRDPKNRSLLIDIRNGARAQVREDLYGNLGQNDSQ